MQQWWRTQPTIRRMETGVTMMTTSKVPMGTQPAVSLHWRAMARTTGTCIMSSMAEMYVAGSKDGTEIKCVMNWNSAVRGIEITMAPIMTSLTGSVLLKEDTF
jgi:hypothetical protein